MSISVCMATYNGAAFVREQVESILAQLADGDELIVIDDRSSDGTADVVRGIGDPRISVSVNDRNRGEVYSFGRAMMLARNDFIFLSDQDDVWIPGRAARMIAALDAADADVVASNFSWMDTDGNPITVAYDGVHARDSRAYARNIIDIFAGRTNYYGCAMAVRRRFIPVVTPIPAFVESHDLWIALAGNLARSNVHVDEHTLRKRKHATNVTSTVSTRPLGKKLRSRAIFARSLAALALRLRRVTPPERRPT